jgi:uncharacterized membrane protein YuzA (DUF378 family)
MYIIYFFIGLVAIFLIAMLVFHFKSRKTVENEEKKSGDRQERLK